MRCIPVQLSHGAYEIRVGNGLLDRLDDELAGAGLKQPYWIVSQARVLKAVGRSLERKFPVTLIPEGERAKTFSTVNRLLDRMAADKLTRQATLVALGGGVVGDVAGFAASIYMRGIAVVQVPTTLLAQVDSSIGGKTGVNHRTAKNLVGTFHQPRLVLADPAALMTLPRREYLSGLYEAIKYGVIWDSSIFEEFERNLNPILTRRPDTVERLVGACAAIKAQVVTVDEKEADLRRILNFGHTVGHGVENAAGYRRIKHGEAVGYGMIAATRIGEALGLLSQSDGDRIEAGIRNIGRLPPLDGIQAKEVIEALSRDKKVRDGSIHFILPRAVGRVEVTSNVRMDLVRQVVRDLLDESGRKR